MSIERDSLYYDVYYENSEEYKKHYKDSVYYDLWKEIIKIIPPSVKVTELGCGVGQFAEMLNDVQAHEYTGFDFSERAIRQAKKRDLEEYNFKVADLTKTTFGLEDNFFICLETLEHTKDFKVIENIGLGKEIIFTVPDFNAPSHVRYFHSVNEVVQRYSNVIRFELVKKHQSWFICKGVTI